MPLPDLNEQKPDDYYYGCDYTLVDIPPSDSVDQDSDELVPNTDPLYQNQMQDPQVQKISDDFYDNLSE